MAHKRYGCGSITCGDAYVARINAKLGNIIPVASPTIQSPPPCAPAWDAWALASCTQALHRTDGASPVLLLSSTKDLN
jgi:hypothetical protein